MSGRRTEKEEFWRFVLAQWVESGLSAREFCRQEGLSEPSFYAWRRKIADRDGVAPKEAVPLPVTPVSDLLPVKINFAADAKPGHAGSGLSAGSMSSVEHQGLEITTPRGLKVRIGEACSGELIERTFVAMGRSAGELSSC